MLRGKYFGFYRPIALEASSLRGTTPIHTHTFTRPSTCTQCGISLHVTSCDFCSSQCPYLPLLDNVVWVATRKSSTFQQIHNIILTAVANKGMYINYKIRVCVPRIRTVWLTSHASCPCSKSPSWLLPFYEWTPPRGQSVYSIGLECPYHRYCTPTGIRLSELSKTISTKADITLGPAPSCAVVQQ